MFLNVFNKISLKHSIDRHLMVTCRMPKSNKRKKEFSKPCDDRNNDEQLPVTSSKDGSVLIKVLAKPGARINAITGISEDGVGIQISAPPADGEANNELVKFLSKLLQVRKSDVSLEKGSKSRMKTVMIRTELSAADIKLKLKEAIDT